MKAPKTLAVSLTITAMAALLGAPAPAHADDSKIYPGEMCNPNVDDYYVHHYWGRLKNNRTTAINFECPIVRDVMAQEIASGNVWVLDQTSTGKVNCTLGMINPTSGGASSASGYFSTRSSSLAGFSSAPQKLTAFGQVGHITDGVAMMICNVPGKSGSLQSGVTSYRINEDT